MVHACWQYALPLAAFLMLSGMPACTQPAERNSTAVAPPRPNRDVADTLPVRLKPAGFVNDFAGLLTPEERARLEALLQRYEKETTHQVVIVTFDTTVTTAANFDHYVQALHNEWGVGTEKNNGIVFAVCPGYRKLRINLGYYFEEQLTDAETQRIINEQITPAFRQNQFYQGMVKGLEAVFREIRAEE